jgi:hypothetical protein
MYWRKLGGRRIPVPGAVGKSRHNVRPAGIIRQFRRLIVDEGPALDSTIEFLTSHCDPTVNLYSTFHVVRGDEVIDVWPIDARY